MWLTQEILGILLMHKYYSPADNQLSFESAQILLNEVEDVLGNVLTKFERVETGYGNSSWKYDCTAYGVHDCFAIILESNNNVINNIWFLLHELTENERKAIKTLFSFLTLKGEFLFTDYSWGFQCKTHEWQLFEKYCESKFTQ